MYSKTTKVTVTGQNLDKGIAVTAASCSGLSELAGGTASSRSYSCTANVTGAMPIVVKSTAGATLSTISPVVPVPQVTFNTTLGDMVIELYPANAPLTVNNFLKYVSSSFYTNLVFHRVVPGFVIQGGGFDAALKEATTNPAIKLEVPNGLSNLRGTIAMARTSVLDSATSQFFINTVDNVRLDTAAGGYAVFGKVTTGLATVDAIAAVPTKSTSDLDNVPVTPVIIRSATQTR